MPDRDDPAPQPAGPPAGKRATDRRPAVLIGVLTALLGFAIAVQLRTTSTGDSLTGARQEDLVRILDDQNSRADRLRAQIATLQDSLRRLDQAGTSGAAARQEARRQADALGVLTGTLPATGPGVVVTITDPHGGLGAEDLLDVVEELRGAGAEAVQFGAVRVGTSSSFADVGGAVALDGVTLAAPYTVSAIGPPRTMDTALNIPGGVAATARNAGGSATVSERGRVDISVVRTVGKNRFAVPSGR